jgi:hypothetical protein
VQTWHGTNQYLEPSPVQRAIYMKKEEMLVRLCSSKHSSVV